MESEALKPTALPTGSYSKLPVAVRPATVTDPLRRRDVSPKVGLNCSVEATDRLLIVRAGKLEKVMGAVVPPAKVIEATPPPSEARMDT